MKDKKGKIVKNATVLGLSAFFSKLLGAIYRVPLTNMLGTLGLGIYQLIFPVYALLLDFSGAGVPSALSRLISLDKSKNEGLPAQKYLSVAVKLFLILGLIFSVVMFVFGQSISTLQGNSNATLGYMSLAPSVLLVSLLSCLRGYFQGHTNMVPTAVSQIVEQTFKLVLGLLFVRLALPNIRLAVAGATLGITFSEMLALLYMAFVYFRNKPKHKLTTKRVSAVEFKSIAKKIIKVTIPITLVGILLPLSHVIDSFVVVNILSTYRQDATALYGILSGVVCTVIGLPVAICYGISTVAIPVVSGSRTEIERRKNANKTVCLTILVALPCAVACAVFAPLIIKILFVRLKGDEFSIAVGLLRVSSINVLLLSLLQTTNAVLIGQGRLYTPVVVLALGVVIKTILSIVLLKIPTINIYGNAIGVIACYFTVCLINLILIFSRRRENAVKRTCRWQSTTQ